MSEELMQVVATPVGKYHYHPTIDTNLQQLRKAGIIKSKVQKDLAKVLNAKSSKTV